MGVDATEIRRTTSKLRDGTRVRYHYAWRGGPLFWKSTSDIKENSPAYFAALAACAQPVRSGEYSAADLVDDYLDSAEFKAKRERTRADYRKWALRLADEFKDDPAEIFEDPESRAEVAEWRSQWAHSPKQYDYAATVATAILNWAVDDVGKLKIHHCHRMKKLYRSDRSEIIWTPEQIDQLCRVAPEWVARIAIAASETGLRVGDLITLGRQHITGNTIQIRTAKRGRVASIPVTPAMRAMVEATPAGRLLVLTNARGAALTPHRASEGLRQWKEKAGLPEHLRLQDMRGTAATRLLRADASLNQIATAMGWSLRYSQNVIEAYAAIVPAEADDVLVLLERAWQTAGKRGVE
ncbi:MAG: tyrosine-type recombinase/integrase [Pseudomonadota bacterium]